MTKAPNSGFRAVIDGLTQDKSVQPSLGHTFVGYRRKSFGEFVAIFDLPGGSEDRHDKYTCEQIARNAPKGSESQEAAKIALRHWPTTK